MKQWGHTVSVLATGARELGLELSPEAVERFARYQADLLDWNQRINLTSITAPEEIQVRHFLDSLTVLAALPDDVRRGEASAALLDVGAGAGFPGLPLAVVLPRLRVTLLEATQKKCRFLEHEIHALGLTNAQVVSGRAEELAHQADWREQFDLVVARAVAPMATLAELCLPFCRVGGRFIAPKKLGIADEIAAAGEAIRRLGGVLAFPIIVRLPIHGDERQLVVVDKVRPTPRAYPRRPGVPAKSPLGAGRRDG